MSSDHLATLMARPSRGLPPGPWMRIPDGGGTPVEAEPGVPPYTASQMPDEIFFKSTRVRRSREPAKPEPASPEPAKQATTDAVSMQYLREITDIIVKGLKVALGKRDVRINELEHKLLQDEAERRRPRLRWMGQWAGKRDFYDVADMVEHGGSSWICTASTNTEPGNGRDWDLAAAAGTKDAKSVLERIASMEKTMARHSAEIADQSSRVDYQATLVADQASDVAKRIEWMKRVLDAEAAERARE
jgi:hypothetical protein